MEGVNKNIHPSFLISYTSECTCPVVQGVGHVAKCMRLMCMHGSYTVYDCITAFPIVPYKLKTTNAHA